MQKNSKVFKTIDEQLHILKKRGMTIPDESNAKEYLLSNNYYNIINGYSKPFFKSTNHYKKGTSFDEVSKLYFFESEIRKSVFNTILEAENHLKSIFAYRFSETYRNIPYAYLKKNVYDPLHANYADKMISHLKYIINHQNQSNNPILYYKNNYNDVPIWVLINYLDLGTLCNLITDVPTQLQNKVALDLLPFIKQNDSNFNAQFSPETMLSFLKNIHETRNICAHSERLIYYECHSDCSYYRPLHSRYNIGPRDSRRRLYSTFLSLQYFISSTEYAKLNNTIRKRMKTLKNKLHSIDINVFLDSLGFPNNWYDHDTLLQTPLLPVDNKS